MRILFMGTDEFAVPSLKALAQTHNVVGVITKPDKPRGRGRRVLPTPVKEAANDLGITVFTPKSLKSKSFREKIQELNYDLVVLVSYGKLLPEDFIKKPPLGCICLHPSMLPEYRGCSPIESAILDGKEKTGISVFYIDREFDTGDIVYQEEVSILPEDTGGSLRERLSLESPRVLLKAIESIEKRNFTPIPQDISKATWAPKIKKEDALINWDETAKRIKNKIRAYNPKPGAFTYFRGKVLKLYRCRVLSKTFSPPTGRIVEILKGEGFTVSCGDQSIVLQEVQPEGKKRMDGWAFVLGYKPNIGEILGKTGGKE